MQSPYTHIKLITAAGQSHTRVSIFDSPSPKICTNVPTRSYQFAIQIDSFTRKPS